MATSAAAEEWPVWSPDGQSIAYHAAADGGRQIFTRNADSSGMLQVTRCTERCESPQWSGDGRRIYFSSKRVIYAVGAAGGEPEQILSGADAFALSPDGGTLVFVRRNTNPSSFSIHVSSPPGAEPVKYEPAPFAAPDFNGVVLAFSPDSKRLLFYVSIVALGRPAEFWMLPLPLGKGGSPRRVLESLADSFPVRGLAWMPDGRRVVVSHTVRPDVFRSHLSIADVETGQVEPLVSGIGNEWMPNVSRDGKMLAYTALEWHVRIVDIPLDGSAVRDLVATNRVQQGAIWSPQSGEFAYVSDKTGQDEVWLADPARGSDRPVVTQKSFQDGELPLIDSLAFAPRGDRIAFSRAARIWIASLSGGVPVRLTQLKASQLAPTWSPDGNWIAFYSRGQQEGVMKARVGSASDPVLIYPTHVGRCDYCTPDWSPDGKWIAYYSAEGTVLLSPEKGGPVRVIRRPPLEATGWSRDGGTLYGLATEKGVQSIVAIDVASGRERVANELPRTTRVAGLWAPSLRLSVSPDGKSVATTSVRTSSDIWTIADFDREPSWMVKLGLRRR